MEEKKVRIYILHLLLISLCLFFHPLSNISSPFFSPSLSLLSLSLPSIPERIDRMDLALWHSRRYWRPNCLSPPLKPASDAALCSMRESMRHACVRACVRGSACACCVLCVACVVCEACVRCVCLRAWRCCVLRAA